MKLIEMDKIVQERAADLLCKELSDTGILRSEDAEEKAKKNASVIREAFEELFS